MQLFTQIGVGGGDLLINLGELGDNVAIANCCHGQVVQGLSDVDGKVGAVKVILCRIHLVLLLTIVIFGGKKMFEMHPCFIIFWFATALLACSLVVSCGPYGMKSRLQDLLRCEDNVAIGGILQSVVNLLELYVNWLHCVDWLVHAFLTFLDVRGSNLSIAIEKMIK